MAFKEKVKALRTEKGWTQKKMAEKIGVHQMQVSAYERGRYLPNSDILIKMAEVFDVSLDYLVFGIKGDNSARVEIKDRELLRQFEEVDKLNEPDRVLAKQMLDLLIKKNRVKELIA
ncbi:MAG: helix-turn-helix transcriptional regulator [Mesoflavibacter sp.]|nr:helix-turn-helix transcriptional regulator [Mesoflavibacter sp.]